MPRRRLHAFWISIDRHGAGLDRGLEGPPGPGTLALHEWHFPTRTCQRWRENEEGTAGCFENIGAWIIEGMHAVLERATAAYGGKNGRLSSGAATIRERLCVGLIDQKHVASSRVLLGSGEHWQS